MVSKRNNNDSNNNHYHNSQHKHTHQNKHSQQPPQKQQQKQQKQLQQQQFSEPEITKTDYAIAKYLRNKLPEKETMFLGLKRVNYFISSKAIDQLMESSWAKGDNALFKTREDARIYMDNLLIKKFYHRAKKIIQMHGEKKKVRLDMHDEQVFVDGNQPYVWLYEPTSIKAWLLSLGVIACVIAICLFPLWPPIIRTWVYYLCVAGLIFLSSVLGLAVLRHIIFIILRILTFDRLHFWILPNLTEDVGFFESFWPLYAIDSSSGSQLEEGTKED